MRRVIEIFGEPISWGGQETYVMSTLQNMDLTDICVDFFTPYYCDNEASKIFIEAHGGRVYVGGLPFRTGGSRREIIPVLSYIQFFAIRHMMLHISILEAHLSLLIVPGKLQ